MDKEKAIAIFLERVERLAQLPLVTDLEMDELFGEGVAAALSELNRFNQKEQICLHCRNRCCQVSNCELYAAQFSQCPIYDFRPVVCRLHFCHRFQIGGSTLVTELTDIFFDSLLAADRNGSEKVRLFDCPPLAITSPDFIAVTSPWVNAVREGSLNPEYASQLIRQKAEKYRTTHLYTGTPMESTIATEAQQPHKKT